MNPSHTEISTEELIADLYQIDGKAEIVGGEIVRMSPTGDMPSLAGGTIFASLRMDQKQVSNGRAYPDNAAFLVDLPNRKSFSPDAAFFSGGRTGMKFLQGAPDFAAEIRSESDYGAAAERRIAVKRADYFAAGTRVVWDVDLQSEDVVKVYRSDTPDQLTVYRRGDAAEAEPAVPGWTVPVDELFE